MDLHTGTALATAALRAGMSENTARRYRTGPLPSARRPPRQYRTRPDPFAAIWPDIEALLREAPGLEAVTIFERLRARPDVALTEGQLRTLQRRIRQWRAAQGPEREVMFPQVHRPGESAQSDFTSMRALGITVAGVPFDHLFYHFVLPYSNWESGGICASESFEALVAGLQAALWELGGVPAIHRTDNLSAATHQLRAGGRTFNERYLRALAHYGLRPASNTPGRGHENGDVEQAHHRFKRAVEQALLLRGSRDFACQEDYGAFLREVLAGRNRSRQRKLEEERPHLRPLPATRLEAFQILRVRVSRFSTIRVHQNWYSVPSRLIGETVEVRLDADQLDVRYAGAVVVTVPRCRGAGQVALNYRHLIGSLVRKPGAFARYRHQAALFPTVVFRAAYDALVARDSGRADVEYLRILQLAAHTSESEVEAALGLLLAQRTLREAAQIKAVVQPAPTTVPVCRLTPPDLTLYDTCLPTRGGLA